MSTMANSEPKLPEHIARDVGTLADPGFSSRLRGELRGRQARATHNLQWFDMELPVGTIRLVHDGELVHLVTNEPEHFDEMADEAFGFEPPHGESRPVRDATESVLAGRRRGSDVAFLGTLPPFQQAVLRTTSSIPRGSMRPYSWVARHAGSPAAVRAAGTALAHNPVPFVIPCHRVVRADWSLGEYSAGGAAVKEQVLRMEGVSAQRLEWLHRQPKYIGQLSEPVFCLPVCPGLDTQDPAELRPFGSLSEAVAAGYEACETCRPL